MNNTNNGVKTLMEALESGLYNSYASKHEQGLRSTLRKLGVKSTRYENFNWGRPLEMEGLSATLNNVTFEDTLIKLWPSPGKR